LHPKLYFTLFAIIRHKNWQANENGDEQEAENFVKKYIFDKPKNFFNLEKIRKVFVNDLEKYSWTKLMDQKIGNQEKMNLYSEALQKFSLSPQLPELFRTIFKSAFPTYLSPETLGLFLTEIDYFDYSHSEELGNAYEYLLSIMSSQGDAGQFRTPRHIIEFVVDVLNPSKDDKILDPACGTGGFLVSAYKNILTQHDGKDDPEGKEKPLTPDQKRKLMQNFEGYDIDPTMVRIAQVNMYLHQFKNPKIVQYDSLSQDEFWLEKKFDVILANPPFMSPKGGIKPHVKFSISSNRSEVLFVDYIINHLKPNGRAGIIVPEGIIFQSGIAYKTLRKNLINDGLYAVVSLPSGVFQPYSGVKTSILLIDKEFAKKSNEILFIKIENDGFDLGAQRRVNVKNDLPQALQILQKFKNHFLFESPLALTATDLNNSPLESVTNVRCNHPPVESLTNVRCNHPPLEGGSKLQGNFGEGSKNFLLVPKSKIAENGDYNLSGDRYRIATDYGKAKWEMVELGEVLDYEQPTKYLVKSVEYKDDYQTPVLTAGKTFILGYTNEEDGIFKNGLPVIIFDDFTTATKFVDFPFKVKSSAMKILHAKRQIANIRYVFYIIQNIDFKFSEHKRFWISEYSKLKIPLPPLEIQEQIVSELDGYSSIIAGAKQIVANWKPKIDIDPSWDMVELGNSKYFMIESGGTPDSKNEEYWNGDINWATLADLPADNHITEINSTKRKITESGLKNSSAKLLPAHSILVSSRATIGRIATNSVELTTNQGFKNIAIKDRSKVNYKYVSLALINKVDEMIGMANGGTFAEISKSSFSKIKIPLPPLEIQEQIVAQIEAEQALIESAKKLIEIYEQKIKEVIAKIWEE